METITDPSQQKVMCPYNPAHYILKSRLGVHLVKCKKNYPDAIMRECDFNITHKIPEPELQYHHENCPDRKKIETAVYVDAGVDLNKYPINNVNIPAEESWDDCDVPSYNPKEYCLKNNILRHLDVAPSAQRKNFRVEERKRLNELTSESEVKTDIKEGNLRSRKNATEPLVPMPEIRTPNEINDLKERIRVGLKKVYIPK